MDKQTEYHVKILCDSIEAFEHLLKSINIVDDIAEMKATGKFIEFKITPTTH